MAVRTDILPDDLTAEQKVIAEHIFEDFSNRAEVRLRSEFLAAGERMRQPRPAKNIDEVTDLVQRVIQDKQNSEEIVSDRQVFFTEEYPPVDFKTEAISFRLVSREPASTSGGRHLNQRRQEWKPKIRSIEDDPNRPGYRVVTMGQKFESNIEFTCWARTNKRANMRALWLEDVLQEYAWYLKYNGIDEFYFLRRDRDFQTELEGNTVFGRPLVYFVRTERLTHVSEPTIRRMIVKFGIGRIDPTD